jgi:hypothetical protein
MILGRVTPHLSRTRAIRRFGDHGSLFGDKPAQIVGQTARMLAPWLERTQGVHAFPLVCHWFLMVDAGSPTRPLLW